MKAKNIISIVLNATACIAFALALVFFPPSASHAASGMHDDHQTVSIEVDHGDMDHTHDDASSIAMLDKSEPVSKTDSSDQTSSNCCNGVCLSFALAENGPVIVEQVASNLRLTLHAQTKSVEPSGFLRPPQYLI
jgi:hypothetical protein